MAAGRGGGIAAAAVAVSARVALSTTAPRPSVRGGCFGEPQAECLGLSVSPGLSACLGRFVFLGAFRVPGPLRATPACLRAAEWRHRRDDARHPRHTVTDPSTGRASAGTWRPGTS
ncbi:hypothetical protein GCM10010344_11870 [Streptomyces bluensis]|nr:hypothetical protein GCM10010344_11870 [Streptomyces bluensis]